MSWLPRHLTTKTFELFGKGCNGAHGNSGCFALPNTFLKLLGDSLSLPSNQLFCVNIVLTIQGKHHSEHTLLVTGYYL